MRVPSGDHQHRAAPPVENGRVGLCRQAVEGDALLLNPPALPAQHFLGSQAGFGTLLRRPGDDLPLAGRDVLAHEGPHHTAPLAGEIIKVARVMTETERPRYPAARWRVAGDPLQGQEVVLLGFPGSLPALPRTGTGRQGEREGHQDRKSTRLNSSHLVISYAVFCLKKK